jgi:hypothetical protein
MKRLSPIGFLFLLLILPRITQAQQVQFSASAKNVVQVGEQFRLTYSVNADASSFQPPQMDGFYVHTGPNPSSSSSVQIINGKVSKSITLSYTYILQASREGEFTIPPASITVDGRQYNSNSVTIKVLPSAGQTPSQPQQPGTGPTSSPSDLPGNLSQEDVFIRSSVDKKNPYLGEQVIITHKIYTRVSIAQYGIDKFPSYNGFWTQELVNIQEDPKKYNEIINGDQYLVAEISKTALFPVKSGELTIEPLQINVVAQVRKTSRQRSNDPFENFFNDPFFGSGYQNIQKSLMANPVTVEVKPLPPENRPADFKGAVGQFSFKSNIDKTNVNVNEAINLKFTILGQGNIRLIDNLDVAFSPDFEVYDPKINANLNESDNNISGVKTFEYLFIPRNPGTYLIKQVPFTYFDPVQNRYVTQQSPAYEIRVAKGSGPASELTYSGVSQEDIQYIGSDIRHIKTTPFMLVAKGRHYLGSFQYLLLIFVPLATAMAFIIYWRHQASKRADIYYIKTRKATKVARERLKKASGYLKSRQEKEFNNEISMALWGYISDKFSIPISELSMETVFETLAEKNVKDTIIEQFIETLNHCEYARFAPGSKSDNMDRIFEEAMNVITKTERELK